MVAAFLHFSGRLDVSGTSCRRARKFALETPQQPRRKPPQSIRLTLAEQKSIEKALGKGTNMKRQFLVIQIILALVGVALVGSPARAENPSVIRLGFPTVGAGN